MHRLIIPTAGALAAMVCPAAATIVRQPDGSWANVPGGAEIAFVLLLLVIVVAIGLAFVFESSISPPRRAPPREKTADEYNAEAVMLAAKRHHTEMQTELRKAEIEAARVDAIHKERDEIIAHDKKVRNLSARLDEKRRAS
jgi:hypothetical protein